MKTQSLIFSTLFFLTISNLTNAQIIDSPSNTVAGIPANYIEAKTGVYTLPDPLICLNGDSVKTIESWTNERRPEIINLYEDNQFGKTPDVDFQISYNIIEYGISAFDGLGKRSQVLINISNNTDTNKILLVYYTPAKFDKPVPLLLYISFSANSQIIDDPEIIEGLVWDRQTKLQKLAGREGKFEKLKVKEILDRGFGIANVYYGDIEPDFEEGYNFGVRKILQKDKNYRTNSNAWGSFAVWSWGLSRILDYFEKDKTVDETKITIMGVSRLGKTALWTGALDERFASVIAICSGESGASLSRRNYGETIAHIASPLRYHYWFAPEYQKYADDVSKLPVDGHMLISLIAPRPLLLITGNTDKWSDPYGEYLAAKAAEPVYHLLGKKGLETEQQPREEIPILSDLSFFMHDGGHGMIESDWHVILDFLQKHF